MTKKTFDCIAFKNEAQSRIAEETQGMSPEERREHLRRKAVGGPLGEWWARVNKSGSDAAGGRGRDGAVATPG